MPTLQKTRESTTALTARRARALLSYDPETGEFRWRLGRPKAKAGALAGTVNLAGYRVIGVDGRLYLAHRLAWLIERGKWPAHEIDHENGTRSDNRWCNLRPATHAENWRNRPRQSNNRSGYKGVYWHPQSGKWTARIKAGSVDRSLGLFESKEDAARAYARSAKELHGKFAHRHDVSLESLQ
jgi:hypothetical protein